MNKHFITSNIMLEFINDINNGYKFFLSDSIVYLCTSEFLADVINVIEDFILFLAKNSPHG